ncbi:hypothetical protein Nepgr_028561 [Nepenthes gracilis]|uniref:Glycosyltransferase n=1 Tax=Nepenthes gracilis TaxID=150966 RepID=A0AAD3TAX8_NEPGR|nr:hypothetical protein Nepgr_028561 [Nepenthes gracilis]
MEAAAAARNPPHIAMVPTPGMGHLISLTEFAKRLVRYHNFTVTFLIPHDGNSTKSQLSILEGLPTSISYSFLPPADMSNTPADTLILTRVILTLTRSLSDLRESLRALAESTRLVALLVDLFGFPAFDLAGELGVPAYMFYSCNALSLCSILYVRKLDQKYTCESQDSPEQVQFFPGCVPVQWADMIDAVQERQTENYKRVLGMAKQYQRPAGVLVNSFVDLEPAAFKSLMQKDGEIAPIYPVGPLIRDGLEKGSSGSDLCLRWLDDQPNGSVLYVSFGSGGTLSRDQIKELAFGLEESGHRFVWVVKSPSDDSKNASFFKEQIADEPLWFLPEGFLERTKGFGMVVPSWAPQVQILSHGSTGGFLSHCGWNSVLESIINGVPIIAWPLFAEQRLNAVELTTDLKVALRVKPNDGGVVERRQISECIKRLMASEEGKMLRERVTALRFAAATAFAKDGSSTKKISELADIWNH